MNFEPGADACLNQRFLVNDNDMVGTMMPMAEPRDNPDELFDLVDADDRVTGTVRRRDAHTNPSLIHRSVQVLVFSTDGKVLLQRRSRHKDLFPGYWCASASGHVGQGETYDETAIREVQEELGIEVPVHAAGKITVRSIYETEITALYTAQSDGPFHFHPIETDGGEFFDQERLTSARQDSSLPMTPALIAAIDALLACAK